MTPNQQECYDLRAEGLSRKEIAERLGVTSKCVKDRLYRADKWAKLDPDMQKRLKSMGRTNLDGVRQFWDVRKDADGGRISLNYNLGDDEPADVKSIIDQAIDDKFEDRTPDFPPRPEPTGENLLIIDIADLHVGKLCVKSETGYTYTRDIARHRAIEGTRALLRHASGHGVGRVLFVLGNDLVHVDSHNMSTTSGTPQDNDGSYHQMVSDAEAVMIDCIGECATVAPVDMVYNPSNHDWLTGYHIGRTVAAWFRNDGGVKGTDYNFSERHRKYYRFHDNLIGLTHGNGAKESDLPALMVREARQHISECPHAYWIIHHFHSKKRNRLAKFGKTYEQDLQHMTIVGTGSSVEGDECQIETVRSPSPPDGWHDRNGYINRQAVECFLHHPTNGQFARFTEWF